MSHQPQTVLLPEEAVAPTGRKYSRYRFVIGGLVMFLNFSLGLSFFAISPVMPLIMDEYAVNRSAASLLTSLVILVQATFAIPGGMLVGRIGLKKLIAIGWLLGATPALSFLAPGFPYLLALRVVYGLSFGITMPAIGPLLMQWFPRKELPLVNSLAVAVVTLGISLSTFTVAPLSDVLGWQGAISIFGAVSLLGMACWLALGRTQDFAVLGGTALSLRRVWGVLRSRTVIIMAAADAGPFAQYTALVAWLPTYYFEVHGMSLARSGSLVGILPLSGVFSVLVAGLLTLRVRRRKPFIIVPGIFVAFAGIGSFLFADTIGVYPALVLLGFASWFYLPILFTIPLEMPGATQEQVSLMLASIMTLGSLLAFISPLTVGFMTDILGTYVPGFTLFAVLAFSLVIGGVLLPETGVTGRTSSNATVR